MSASGLFGIGGNGSNLFHLNVPSTRNSGAFSLKTAVPQSGPDPTIDQLRVQLLAASAALGDAFRGFTNVTKAVYTTSVLSTPALQASLRGTAPHLTPRYVGYSALQTTLKINTKTSTDRLSSSAVGLDVTSAAAASRLESSAGLGLDITSPETASILKSSATLGLDVTSPQSTSTIRSTAEMNTATTSLSAYDLAFASSTSYAQVSGAYSGTATSLTFKITAATTISGSASLLSFRVTDQSNNQVATYTGMVTAGQVLDVGSTGLKVRFTAGTLGLNTTSTANVSQTGTDVNAAALFNAGWGSAPVFENYQTVSAGSFTINGTTIAVNANDSINSVISRINSSAAGVTASVSGDKIKLSTNSKSNSNSNSNSKSNSDSEDNIVLGGDTSGFLAATRLSGATTTRGNVRDDQRVLSKTTQFSSVTSGSFSVNGVSISVNKDTDTLTSIMSRINSSGAGVTASFDSAQNKLILNTTGNSEDLITVSGDTTGFLTAAKLSTNNTVRGNIRDDQQVLSKTTQFSSVTSGSFAVNGVSISINKDTDTVTSIVNRINTANAGVTAAFNSSTNKIVLTGTSNSEDLITVGSDTTGFLHAANLNTGNTVRGNLPDDQQVFSKTSQFAAVTSGSFTVNGASISVDASQDTLQTVIGKINSAGAGVTASYNGTSDKLVFTPNVAGSTLSLEGDTSGFLAAGKVAAGTVGTHVNAAAAFNATGLNSPLFDAGNSVQAGAFTVNGVAITVAANDSINTVLAKITASDAGVTATYDNAAQTVRLTSKQETATPITVGGDTSGFLTAVKLNQTAQSTTGTAIAPFDSALNRIDEYSSVGTGAVTVNGHQIAIDPATTTIRGLVSALDSIEGISATLNENTGRISVSSQQTGGSITISDTSGVLSTLGIAGGSYRDSPGTTSIIETQTGTTTESNGSEVAASVSAAADKLNEVLSQLGKVRDSLSLRSEMETTIQSAIDSLRGAGAQGLSWNAADGELRVTVDPNKLAGSLTGLLGGGGQDENGLGPAIDGLLDGFTQQTATFAAPRASEPPKPDTTVSEARDAIKAQLADNPISPLLLLKKSSFQTDTPAASIFKKAAEAYDGSAVAALYERRQSSGPETSPAVTDRRYSFLF